MGGRINPLHREDALADLRATISAAPHGIVLPKPTGTQDSNRLSKLLDVLEQEHELDPGSVRIMPIATEQPAALFQLHEYASATRRIYALTWGAEDLSSAIGASASRDDNGSWLPPYELARSLCLFAAAAAGLPALDTVFTDFRNADGLARYAAVARRDGFAGMLAIHPDQVTIINEAFVPTAEEIDRAQKILDLFSANPGSGTLDFDGEMVDRPHLVQARKLLKMAGHRQQSPERKEAR